MAKEIDGGALERLLAEHPCDLEGVVLRLAWRAGLTRDEIWGLAWDEVDSEGRALRLTDRQVPLTDDAAECLETWRRRVEGLSPWVAVSQRNKQRVTPQHITRLTRDVLSGAGLEDTTLRDLRRDYIRARLKTEDWQRVTREAGLSVQTYRNDHAALVPAEPQESGKNPWAYDDFRLWKVLQAEKDTAAGLALWLSWQMGLELREMTELVWGEVDFDGLLLRLPGREVPMTRAVERLLRAEREKRAADDDPHVLLSPRARRPMDSARLTTLVRDALVRGGIENTSLRWLRGGMAEEEKRAVLRRRLQETDSLTCGEAAAALQTEPREASRILAAMVRRGEFARAGYRYYAADSIVPPEKHAETVTEYIAANGPAYLDDIARLLRVEKKTASGVLKRMKKAGELVLLSKEQRYALPGAAAETENGAARRKVTN